MFNAEDDIHYPQLTVEETLSFALKNKTPHTRVENRSRPEFQGEFLDNLLKTYGIEHTRDTLVGNEFVRGVSGGERKVSLSLLSTTMRSEFMLMWSVYAARVDSGSPDEPRDRQSLGLSLPRARRIYCARVYSFHPDGHRCDWYHHFCQLVPGWEWDI